MSEVIYSKKQINPLIEKFSINVEKNETFNEIIKLFQDQTNYQVWAIKAVFGGICPLSVIKDIKSWADANQQEIKNLIKGNIVSYTKKNDFTQLMDEINGLNMISLVKGTINRFNTHQRELLRENILKNISNGIDALASSLFKKWHNLFSQVETMNKAHKDRLISTSSSLHTFRELEDMINHALSESYLWDREDLIGFVKRNAKDCEIVYDKDNIVIITVGSFRSSKMICGGGRTCWCLTKQESYFNDYVKRHSDATQYFYFDFNLPEKDDLAHIGFTIRHGQGITNAHCTSNGSMLGSGIRYKGENINIQKALRDKKIDMGLFMRLRPLKNYQWSFESLVENINVENSKNASIVFEKNKILIIKFNDLNVANKYLGHTFINVSNIARDNQLYAIFDMNKNVNDSMSIYAVRINKDKYGVESPSLSVDAYNAGVNNFNEVLRGNGIKVSDFITQSIIDPNILLHKYIDEKDETSAIELLNSKKIDVNFLFENRSPIHKIIENKMTNLFRCVINNDSFDVTIEDAMDEPLLQSMLYLYKSEHNQNVPKSELNKLKTMINDLIDLEKYNINVKNDNFDTAVNVAAEYEFLNWALIKLVDMPNVNLNVVNDFNCTSLGNAIRKKNIDGIKILGRRKDLVVRDEDKELASKYDINLESYINPDAMHNSTDGLDVCELTSELAELFAKAFNLYK